MFSLLLTDQMTWAGCSCPDPHFSSTQKIHSSPHPCGVDTQPKRQSGPVSLRQRCSLRSKEAWVKMFSSDETNFTEGAASESSVSKHVDMKCASRTLLRGNNRYLSWMQFSFSVLIFSLLVFDEVLCFNFMAFCTTFQSRDSTFKVPQYVPCRENASDLNGHWVWVSESERGRGWGWD